MIRINGMVLTVLSLFVAFTAMPMAKASLFGSIESVDVLKQVAENQAKKKDNRAIASDTATPDAVVEGDTGPSATATGNAAGNTAANTAKDTASDREPVATHKK